MKFDSGFVLISWAFNVLSFIYLLVYHRTYSIKGLFRLSSILLF